MTAGRFAEALTVFDDARRELLAELGLEPGLSLQRLHRQMLSTDPSLGAPERDRAVSAEADQALRSSLDELGRLREQLANPIGVMDSALRKQCLELAHSLAQAMEQLWEALSDFRGADLRPVDLEPHLEDLDGVRWSDDTATGEATRWPAGLRDRVARNSTPVAGEPGVWLIRFGVVVAAR